MYKYLQPGALSTKFIVQLSKDSAWISRQTDDTAVFFSDTVVFFCNYVPYVKELMY